MFLNVVFNVFEFFECKCFCTLSMSSGGFTHNVNNAITNDSKQLHVSEVLKYIDRS